MSKKTLLFAVVIVCAAAVVVSAGGAREPEGPVDLRFTVWTGAQGHLDLLNSIASDYTAQNTDVTVRFVTIPFADYVTNVTIQLAGADRPDAGWLVETNAPEFIDAGVVMDVSAQAAQYDMGDWFEPALELWRRGDQLFGIPFSTSPFLILYNEDLFAQAGVPTPRELSERGEWTWEAFADASRQIREATGVYGFQTMDGQGYDIRVWHTLVPILRSYGTDVWDQDNNVLLNTPEAVRAVQLFHDMVFVDESVVPPGDRSDFYVGDAAMTVGQISRVPQLQDADFSWSMAVMPEGPAGRGDVIGQAGVVAYSAGGHSDIAADFVAFMTNEENVARLAQFFPPARESVLESEEFLTANPDIPPELMREVVADSIRVGRVLSFHTNFSEIDLESRGAFDSLWRRDADVQTALDEVAEVIEPLVRQ